MNLYADQLEEVKDRIEVQKAYNQRYRKTATPLTNPELYDPLEPPEGWRYDYRYEMWVAL
jgi:hypothetical protein